MPTITLSPSNYHHTCWLLMFYQYFFSLNRVKEQAAKEVMEKERALKEKEEEVYKSIVL